MHYNGDAYKKRNLSTQNTNNRLSTNFALICDLATVLKDLEFQLDRHQISLKEIEAIVEHSTLHFEIFIKFMNNQKPK